MIVLALALTMLWNPAAAQAAAGPINTSAQGARVNIGLLGILGVPSITLGLPVQQSWTTGGSTATKTDLGVDLLPGVNIIKVGAITATAQPATGGGRAQADVAGLNLLGVAGPAAALNLGAIKTWCQMTSTGITGQTDIASLKVLGASINPDVNLDLGNLLSGIASGWIDHRTAAWDSTTGRLDYTLRAVDLKLLKGTGLLNMIANGDVVIAESVCSGIVKLGSVATSPVNLIPGNSATPSVTVQNSGDIAAPNTTITIPAPPAGYTVGAPSITGSNGTGSCTAASSGAVTCTNVTVPGGGTVTVNVPVTLSATATNAADWSPAARTITAVSTPVTGSSTVIPASGSGTLVAAQPAASTGGSFAVTTPSLLTAGKTATTAITVANQGPSNATTTVTIPIDNAPAGVTVTSAKVGSTPCNVTTSAITCSGVSVPAGSTATITVGTSATLAAVPGTVWNLQGMTANLNGTPIGGQAKFLTIGDPDVNLTGGVSITPANGTPGGGAATASVRVVNIGGTAANPTTINIPAPPAGYTVGAVTTSNGSGTCTTRANNSVQCTNVSIPSGAANAVTLSIPVTLASSVTTNWAAAAGAEVSAATTDSTGLATGTIINAVPRSTLGITATGPADRTVNPGQTTSMAVNVYNQGPSDARNSAFVVVAPPNTTFGTLTAPTSNLCTNLTSSTLRCTISMGAGDPATGLTLPLVVSAAADPATPITGGCVSLDNDSLCDTPATDKALPTINLRTPLSSRLTTSTDAATITPGTSGTGKLTLTSTQAETAMTVTIPTTGLPTGFTVGQATVAGGAGTCQAGSGAITCTGVTLTAGQAKDISVPITVASSVVPPQAWTPSGIVIATADEQVSRSGSLAGTGTGNYTLTTPTLTVPVDGSVEPGGTTSMQVAVRNNGPSDATGATFSVRAPAGTTFGALSAPATPMCTLTSSTVVTCTTTLAANASTPTLTLPLLVGANTDPDKTVTGGCVDLDGTPGCGSSDTAIPSFKLKVPFSAQVTVTADRADVTPGSTATATVHVAAPHNDLSGVTVTIPLTVLPAGLTVTGQTPAGCTRSASAVTCTGLSIIKGNTADIGLTVAATSGSTTGTGWTATGITVASGSDSITSTQEMARVGAAQPVLAASITPPSGTLLPGSTSNLDVAVTNNGPSDAKGAPVVVTAPLGATFSPLNGATATACTLSSDSRTATCSIDLAAGAPAVGLSFPLRIDATAAPGSTLTGGCVDLDGQPGCSPTTDKPIATITVGTPLQRRLTVTTNPAALVPGQNDTAQLNIKSTTSESGLTVTIPTTNLPAGVTASSATVPGGTCTVNASAIVCSPVNLSTAGQTVTVTLNTASLPSTAPGTWTAAGITVTKGSDTATASGDLAVVGQPQTALTADATVPASGTVSAGGNADITVKVSNGGPSNATPATFTVRAPTGTTFAGLPPNTASVCTVGPATVATCTENLAANADTGNLIFPVAVPVTADPFVALSGGCVDLDGAAACSASDKVIPSITLKVPFDRRAAISAVPATVTPGDSGTVKVRATALNSGDNLTNVTLTVPLASLPAGMTVGTPSPGSCAKTGSNPDTVVCSNVSITGGGAPFELTLPVSATGSTASGVTWTATGITMAAGGESISANRALATTTAGTYALNPTVTMPSGSIEPGATTSIGISITNPGPSNATGAKIAYIAPAGTTFSTPTGALAVSCTLDSPTRISCNNVNLAGGATGTLTLPIVVDPSADPSKPISGGCVDGNADGYCTSDPADTAFGSFNLTVPFTQRVTVTTTPATVSPGTSGTSNIVVSNTGNTNLTGLTVTVPVPAGGSDVTLTPTSGCSIVGSNIVCPNVSVTANSTTTIPVGVAMAGGAPPTTAYAATVSVTDGTPGNTVTARRVVAGAGAPAYTLAAQLTGPATDTVLPGTATSFTAVISNSGTAAALTAPVTITAPTGTTFGTLTAPVSTACTLVNPTTLSCGVDVSAGAVPPLPATWTLPINVPAGTAAATLTGGCIDLNDNGACAAAEQLPTITMRKALSSVLAPGGTPPTITPGATGSSVITLAASEARTGLVVGLDPAGLPTGVTVTSATINTTDCTVTANAVSCPATTIAAGATAQLTVGLSTGPSSPTSSGAGWSQALTVTQGAETLTLHPTVAKIGAPVSSLAVVLVVPDAGTLKPGTTGEMDVTLTNPGPSAYPNARAVFKAPTGTTFAALTGVAASLCTVDSPTEVSCGASLGVESKSFTLGISVPANANTNTPLTGGCVDVNNDGNCTSPGDRTIPNITLAKPFSQQAQLGISPLTIVPGTSDTAYLTVAPDRALNGMSATVPLTGLPQGLTVITVTGPSGSTCTWVGAITCTGVNATTSTTNLISITVRAAASMASGTLWTPNPVTLTSAGGDAAQVTGVLVRTGAASTGLSFDMSAPTTPVAPGSTATIVATASNSGPSDATGLVARLIAPTGTIFGPLTGRAATDCTPVGNTQLDCRTNLPVGAAAAQWTLPVRIPANASPNATITGGCIDLNRDGACAAAPTDYPLPSIAVRATLDQAVTATANNPAIVPGRHGAVTVTLTATRAASAVTVTIPTSGLPSGVSIAQAQSTSGTCTVVTGAITCTGVNVPVGIGGTTITFGADVAAGATPSQPAWTPSLTLVEAGVTAAKAISSTLVGAADAKPVVSFTVPAAQSLKPGDSGAIQVTVTNQGTSVAKNVHYMFRAPTGTTFLPPTGTTASLCTRNNAGTVVDCTLNVDGSAKVQFPLPLQVSPTADPASPVTSGCADVNLDNNCGGLNDVAIPSIQLGQPAGQLVITGTPGTVTPGSTATGQVRVTSAGAITGATVVVPLSTLPAGFTVTGATGPGSAFCSVSTTEVRCTGVALGAGTTTAVTITTRAAATVAPGTAWRATGVTVTAGSDSATGAADVVTSGARVAAVTFKTTNASDTVKPGDSTSMSVVATNAGPSNAVRKTVTMTAPASTTIGPLTGVAAQDCVVSGTTVTCTYDLDATQSKTYTVPLVVSSSVKNGDKLTGACVTSDGTKTCGSDVTVSADNTPANPSISKTGTLSLTSAVVATGASGTAVVRFLATVAHTGLTLDVPLGALPDGFTVKSAAVDGATCTVGATAISCTGVTLVANQAKTLSIGVDVASTAAATAAWTATGITLADPKDADDKLTASGLLVSTSKTAYSVGVTVGSPSNTAPLPGQTTTLPITFTNSGPGDASPFTTTILLPANTTAGTLPTGCVVGETARTIVCTVSLAPGTSRLIQVPVVIGSDLKGGETLTGGCVDGVLGTDPQADGECGGDADVSIPELTTGRFKVNLAVTYDEPAMALGPNSTGVVVKIPYTNEGTDTADNVSFTVVPPAGVVVRSASILLDNSTVSEGVVAAAATAETVAATCTAAGGKAAANAVVCTAPDAAGLYGSQLWLTIDGSKATKSGTQAMKVTISTTSAEGTSQDNTVSVMLKLTAKAAAGGGDDNDDGNNGGGGKLPTTGAQIAGTGLVSLLMIVAGVTLMLAMRDTRRPAPVPVAVRIPDYTPRHSRAGGRSRRWSLTRLLRGKKERD